MTAEAKQALTWRKIALQSVIGFVAGGGGMVAVMTLVDPGDSPAWEGSHIAMVGVGLVYVIMGLFVGIGVVAPRLIGQRLLNVADAEEIDDERFNLVWSALGCIGIGLALALLAYAATGDPAAPIGPVAAFWLFAGMLAALTTVSVVMWRRFDELWKQLTIDASAIFGNGLLVILALWGGAASAGIVAGPDPLDLVSLAFGGMLLCTFVAAFRRGMGTPQ